MYSPGEEQPARNTSSREPEQTSGQDFITKGRKRACSPEQTCAETNIRVYNLRAIGGVGINRKGSCRIEKEDLEHTYTKVKKD